MQGSFLKACRYEYSVQGFDYRFLLTVFQSVLHGEVEGALFGFNLSELLSVWSELAEVVVLGQEGSDDVEFSARETNFHNPQLLVLLRMLQMIFDNNR